MQKLFTCRYGSKLYGTDTPSSDDDFKTVYLPSHIDLMLNKVVGITDNSKKTTEGVKNSNGDIDSQSIPLQRFAYDFYNGVTYAVEIVWAYQSKEKDTNFQLFVDSKQIDNLMNFLLKYKNNNIQGMVGYAWGQAQKYKIKGARVKALIWFKEELETFSKFHIAEVTPLSMFMSYLENRQGHERYIYLDEVEVNGRTLSCMNVLEKQHLSTTSIHNVLKAVKKQLEKYGHRAMDSVEDEGTVDWKSVHHAIRLMNQTVKYISEGRIEIPYSETEREFLIDVKRGDVPYSVIVNMMQSKLDYIDENKENSVLPKSSKEMLDNFEKDLYYLVVDFYKGV